MVVDAGSTDGSQEIVKSLCARNLVMHVESGLSEAAGQAFAVDGSSSDVVMFTNSDIYVPPNWVQQHINWLQRGYDLVGGKVFWGGDKFSFTWNMPTPRNPQFVQRQGMGLGFSNCSVKRGVFTKSGGIRDMVSQQDTDFAFRVVRMGGKMILDPSIVVYHDHPLGSLKASFRRSFVYARNHIVVMRATYGRIVIGSGHPAMISISSLVLEWLAINGVRAYLQHNRRALQEGIRSTLLEFIFIRLSSTKLPQMLGVFVGATMRRVSLGSVTTSHRSR